MGSGMRVGAGRSGRFKKWCSGAYSHGASNSAVKKLKRLADEFDAPWEYAPLHHFLNLLERPAPTRVPLPLT